MCTHSPSSLTSTPGNQSQVQHKEPWPQRPVPTAPARGAQYTPGLAPKASLAAELPPAAAPGLPGTPAPPGSLCELLLPSAHPPRTSALPTSESTAHAHLRFCVKRARATLIVNAGLDQLKLRRKIKKGKLLTTLQLCFLSNFQHNLLINYSISNYIQISHLCK